MGPYYTLLRFDPTIDLTGLMDAACRCGVPLTVLDVAPRENIHPYRHALLLNRPDFHVAWRGDAVPSDPQALMDLVRGAATGRTQETSDVSSQRSGSDAR
jgi:hypothetical protein